MTKETLTVHQALCELKVADNKINKLIRNGLFCETRKESVQKINGVEIPEFEEQIKKTYQKVSDLIKRVDALKRAISLSNAKTIIKVAGKEMTVAEAIYAFKHGNENKLVLIEEMRRQYTNCTTKIARENGAEMERKRDAYINQLFSNRSDAKLSDIRNAEDDFTRKNTLTLVDPIHLQEKINSLQDEVDEFKSQLDAVLQMSNATTVIDIEY